MYVISKIILREWKGRSFVPDVFLSSDGSLVPDVFLSSEFGEFSGFGEFVLGIVEAAVKVLFVYYTID